MTLTEHLGQYVSEHKKALIADRLKWRTRFLTVVLEDIYQSHNASAVLRSCDCFGIQDVHVVEQRNKYDVNPGVALGSSKWVDIHHYRQEDDQNIEACYATLKSKGYVVAATTSDPSKTTLKEFEINQPAALVFGTELNGLTDFAMDNADAYVHIPMKGFTESFNISVSAAICLYELTGKLAASDLKWQLSTMEQDELRLRWYKRIVRNSKLIEAEFLRGQSFKSSTS